MRFSSLAVLCIVPAVAAQDQVLFVANRDTTDVVRVDASSGDFLGVLTEVFTELPGGPRALFLPFGRNLFVTEGPVPGAGSRVAEYDPATGDHIRTFGDDGSLLSPRGLALGPNESLLVVSHDTSQVLQYDLSTGALIGPFTSGCALMSPHGLVVGPNGNLFVADTAADSIIEFDGQSGVCVGVFVDTGMAGPLDGPTDVGFGPDGRLYVASSQTGQIIAYDRNSGDFLGVFAEGCGLEQPGWFTFRRDGHLLVNHGIEDKVALFDVLGNCVDEAFLDDNIVAQPRGLVLSNGEPGACCSFFCEDRITQDLCEGIWAGEGSVCASDCEPFGTCCLGYNSCLDNETEADCKGAGGYWRTDFECSQLVECCDKDQTCYCSLATPTCQLTFEGDLWIRVDTPDDTVGVTSINTGTCSLGLASVLTDCAGASALLTDNSLCVGENGEASGVRVLSTTPGESYHIRVVPTEEGSFPSCPGPEIDFGPILEVIVQHPSPKTSCVGASVAFGVEVDPGLGVVCYQWFKESEPLPGSTMPRLVLPRIEAGSAGSYYCRVTTPLGEFESDPAVLSVTRECQSDFDIAPLPGLACAGSQILVADLDSNAFADIVVACPQDDSVVVAFDPMGNQSESIALVGFAGELNAIAAGRFNLPVEYGGIIPLQNDKRTDIVIGSDHELGFFQNEGERQFTYQMLETQSGTDLVLDNVNTGSSSNLDLLALTVDDLLQMSMTSVLGDGGGGSFDECCDSGDHQANTLCDIDEPNAACGLVGPADSFTVAEISQFPDTAEIEGECKDVVLVQSALNAIVVLPCKGGSFLQCGQPAFCPEFLGWANSGKTYVTGDNPSAVLGARLAGGDWDDVAVTNRGSASVSIFLNNGGDQGGLPETPTVTIPVGREPSGLVATDLDADGDIDLAIANQGSDSISVLRNDGDGTTFTSEEIQLMPGSRPVSLATGDINGDGVVDIAVAGQAQVFVLVGHVGALNPGDCDGDGDIDLLDYETFQACVTDSESEVQGCACADFNSDERVDLIDWGELQRVFTGPLSP